MEKLFFNPHLRRFLKEKEIKDVDPYIATGIYDLIASVAVEVNETWTFRIGKFLACYFISYLACYFGVLFYFSPVLIRRVKN